MTRLLMLLSKLLQKHRKMKKWKRIVTTLAAVVTFVTTYALILPAITVEKNRADEVAGLYLEEGTAGEAAAIHSDEGNVDRAGDMYPEQEAAAEIMTLKATGSDYTVILSYDETSKVPEGATLAVSEIAQDSEEYKTYLEETKKAMGYAEEDTLPRYAARFFDIKIMDGNQEFTPESGVSVEIAYDEPLAQQSDAEVRAVHFADDAASAEVIEANAVEPQNEETSAVEFTAESFSVYGVIYTVDFEYSVDGETYEFSLPGGGFVSFSDLIEVLGITNVEEDAAVVEDETEEVPAADGMPDAAAAEDETEEVPAADGMPDAAASDAAKQFTENIESVEFSAPRLVWVGKVDADTTVGALKEENALECEYSAELTEEEIAEINARKVESKDWALISMRPFTSEESLTVTMKDGEAFTVKVTDYQISTNVLAADGNNYRITVTFDDDAEIPKGAKLEVSELANDNRKYTHYVEQAAKALAGGEEIPFVNAARLFDISIVADGKKIEPKAPVEVRIEYVKAENLNKTSEVGAVHFKKSLLKTEAEVMDADVRGEDGKVDGVTFTTDSFSIYAVVVIDKEAGTFVVEDENYKVTIAYTREANIPIGTELTVKEITPEEDRYWELRKNTIEKINEGVIWEDTELTPDPRKGVTDAAFFDIDLVYAGTEIEPDVPLQVKIEYKNGGVLVPENESTQIIHFGKEETETIEDVDVQYSEKTEDGKKVAVSYEYEQSGFSAVGSYSTGKYIDINESTIINPTAGILAAPMLGASKDSSITASKTISDDDHDGVYDLTLSVTGQSESSSSTIVNKSNIVIVVDVSGSMSRSVYSKYRGTDTSGTYYGLVNGNYLELTYFDGQWHYYARNTWRTYSGDMYIKETRLGATKRALKELVSALLANNKNEVLDGVNLNDIMEITLVKFADPVENSRQGWNGTSTLIRNVNTDTEKDQLDTIIDNLWEGGGTDWERALQVAKDEADIYKRNQSDEPVSVIFMTDGVPTMWGTSPDNGGDETIYNTHTGWNAADDDARSIVSSGYTLYDIFAFGTDTVKYTNTDWWGNYEDGGRTDADYLRALTNYAYSGSGTYANTTLSTAAAPYFFNAKDTTALQDAFAAIIKRINGNVGYGGVTVDDGVTVGITNTSLTVEGTINTNNIRYTIKNGNVPAVSVKIDGDNNTATFTSATTGATTTVSGVPTTVYIDGADHTNILYTATLDGVEYKITPASMDPDGKVVWELAPVGIIENGITYELTFDVWPRQLAYDIVADLNNGVKTLDQIRDEVTESEGTAVWNQIYEALVKPGDTYVNEDGETVTAEDYIVRTNYEQYVDYYTVDTTQVDGDDPVTTYTSQPRKELGPKDPVDLAKSSMKLTKIWDDSLDEDQLGELLYKDYPAKTVSSEKTVKFHIWKADTLDDLKDQISKYSEPDSEGSYAEADAHDYMDKTVGWKGSEYNWEESLNVAPGHMIEISKAEEMGIDLSKHTQVKYGEKTYLVLETGHYYTVTEENIDRHFELNTIIYHPMLVDGVLSNVTFKEDGTVEDIEPLTGVEATNTIKGGLNVQKKVFDGEGNKVTEVKVSDDTFKVKITMQKANGSPYEDWDYRIYYGQNNPNGSWNAANQDYGRTDHIYGSESTGNGGIIEAELYIGDVLRIVNIPAGVTYDVQETDYDDEIYTPASGYTFPFTTGGSDKSFTTDESGISYMISRGENDNYVADSGKKIVGNSASQAIVVNKAATAKIKLLKLGDSTTPLKGVQFKIFYDEECTKAVTKDAVGKPIPSMNNGIVTTDSNGYADLGTLAGTYYLKEIATNKGYVMLAAPVRIDVGKERVTASCAQEGVIFSTPDWIEKGEDGIWVVKVNNSSGFKLPSTGGRGTRLFSILGSILTIGAGMLLWRRRRTI